ncbi:hypothetical protein [Rhizobium sp. L1K21]|uniref:hypothetical protein n=1 Tax=Rhizobium sp. L1K21 TaxID=2954933 RepID=UPI002093625F|nr:hypothetical protein [Rhizobium sp. L1K21]MCO6187599.1 hypothetical protein [Rhizobium sp. L1K21]
MSRYMVNKVLWRYSREDDFRAAFDANPEAALKGFSLSADEHAALSARDQRAIFLLGAHPFLIYAFMIAVEGGWSFEFMQRYVDKLQGVELQNIET